MKSRLVRCGEMFGATLNQQQVAWSTVVSSFELNFNRRGDLGSAAARNQEPIVDSLHGRRLQLLWTSLTPLSEQCLVLRQADRREEVHLDAIRLEAKLARNRCRFEEA